MATSIKAVRAAEREVQRAHPGLIGDEFDGAVYEVLCQWESDVDHEEPADNFRMESGRDNCDDWGTGEGQFHGRM